MEVPLAATQSAASGRAGRVPRLGAAGSLVLRSGGLFLARPHPHISAMPDPAAERERDDARLDRETLLLAYSQFAIF